MPRKPKTAVPSTAVSVDSYKHTDTRKRIPTQEESEKLSPQDKRPTKTKYHYDPSLDPQLVWAGKTESGNEFGVSTVPIYVQEQIAPEAIISRLKMHSNEDTGTQSLFGDFAADQFNKAVSFYEHEDNWQNRLILGDSLLVMNSLLEKEGMRGQVQCVYIDPPYGIKFGSNWQASTRKREVKDNKIEDMIRQPEQIKAFRDTWELGIHSYLSYLRDRLITARELLTESGSCFMQISDENLHLIRSIMDEVFGSENFVAQIAFVTTSSQTSDTLPGVCDYVVWYAKDKSRVKYHQLYTEKVQGGEGATKYNRVRMGDGTDMPLREAFKKFGEDLPAEAKIFRVDTLTSQSGGDNSAFPVEFEGELLRPRSGYWKTSEKGMRRLVELGRVVREGRSLGYVRFIDDFPAFPIANVWTDQASVQSRLDPKVYVVQTATKVIQRCLLMTTDPGDIVVDPTCGSGTTAFVAEQWGRRWITIDTSRVALALARTRLMTAKYAWYKLKEERDIRAGFEYKTVPHITLKSLANDEQAEQEVLYDQPHEQKEKIRVAGPFTVESLSPHRISDAGEMISSDRFVEIVVANLLKAGVQTGDRGGRLEFINLDILPSAPEVQASGEYKTEGGVKRAAVSIGPEFGSIDDDFIRAAVKVARRFADLLVIAGTSFEASAFTESGEIEGLRVMRVKINPDLSMGDLLKKTGAGNLFLAFGEPEIRINEGKDGYSVEVVGVDVYDPVKNEIRSSGSGDPEHEIAAWFVDTNYNGQAFFVTHAYFLGSNKPYENLKKALKADIPESAWEELYSTTSRHFPKPETGRVAVKVINHYGDEVMKVLEV